MDGVLSVVEQQPYKVISDINGIQIRDYPASVYAQVSLNDNPDRVGRKAFTPLIRYVSSNSIPMTAPVVQEADGEGWNFSFVMPAGSKASDLTQPSDTVEAVVYTAPRSYHPDFETLASPDQRVVSFKKYLLLRTAWRCPVGTVSVYNQLEEHSCHPCHRLPKR